MIEPTINALRTLRKTMVERACGAGLAKLHRVTESSLATIHQSATPARLPIAPPPRLL